LLVKIRYKDVVGMINIIWGTSALIRDSNEYVVAMVTWYVEALPNSDIGKTLGVRLLVQFSLHMKIFQVIFEAILLMWFSNISNNQSYFLLCLMIIIVLIPVFVLFYCARLNVVLIWLFTFLAKFVIFFRQCFGRWNNIASFVANYFIAKRNYVSIKNWFMNHRL